MLLKKIKTSEGSCEGCYWHNLVKKADSHCNNPKYDNDLENTDPSKAYYINGCRIEGEEDQDYIFVPSLKGTLKAL